MRIVIDLTPLADNFSGIERYALNISKEMVKLDKKNNYILIFKNSVHPSFKDIIKMNNVEHKVIFGNGRVLFSQIKLAIELYRIKADKYLFLAFPGPLLFKRKGIINTIHDLTAWDYPNTMKFLPRVYFKLGIYKAIKASERIITVSQFSKKRILEKFGINNVSVIYNGISEVFLNSTNCVDKVYEAEIRKKYSLPDKYLMCLCTLEPRKNIELLIKAYLELRNNYDIKQKLVLVGRKGWKIENLINEIDNNYKDEIIVTGFVDDNDLPIIYKLADCFVFPSLYEGFGIPVIEAMYMNVNVICSNSSALPEVVEGAGILFENNNKEDLKKKIIEFINEDKEVLLQRIAKAHERASRFNWSIEAEKLTKIITMN